MRRRSRYVKDAAGRYWSTVGGGAWVCERVFAHPMTSREAHAFVRSRQNWIEDLRVVRGRKVGR